MSDSSKDLKGKRKGPSPARSSWVRGLLVGGVVMVVLVVVCLVISVQFLLPMELPSLPSPTLPAAVTVAEGAAVSPAARRLGQLTVNRPLRMSPGSTGSFFASLGIPEQYASIIPTEIEIITVPQDKPVEVGERDKDFVDLYLTEQMGLDLIAPAFRPVTADPLTQTIQINDINAPVFWSWTLTAPEAIGLHEVELKTYHIVNGQRRAAIPARIYQIEVVALTPTPAPAVIPTPTPIPVSFWQTPLGTTVVGGAFTIGVALIGLLSIYLGKEHLPLINTRASKQRRLVKLRSNLDYLKEQAAAYGAIDVPVKLRNEIAATEAEIEAVETELRTLAG